MNLPNSFDEFNDQFGIPLGVLGGVAAVVSIIKDSPWYVSVFCIVVAVGFTVYTLYRRVYKKHFRVTFQRVSIKIEDADGALASYKIESILKACKKYSNEFEYRFYGDGNVRNFQIDRGTLEQREEANKIILKALTQYPIKHGKEEKQILTCEMHDCFKNSQEFWETSRITAGTNIQLAVYCHPARPFKECRAYKVHGSEKEFAKNQPIITILDGMPALLFEIMQANIQETFRIEWSW